MANNNGFVVRVPKVASQSKDAKLYGTLKDIIARTNEQFAGCATQADLTTLAEIVAALTAADIAFVPAGGLAATNVQDALVELDTEKIGGSGTINYIPMFTAARVLADSPAYTDSSSVFFTNDIVIGKSTLGARLKMLTEGVATTFVTIAVPSGGFLSGECQYSVAAGDGTDIQARSGRLRFVAVSKAGTVTVSINEIGSQEVAVSAGTLTAALTAVAGAGSFVLQCNATSSLVQLGLQINYRLDILNNSATVTGA